MNVALRDEKLRKIAAIEAQMAELEKQAGPQAREILALIKTMNLPQVEALRSVMDVVAIQKFLRDSATKLLSKEELQLLVSSLAELAIHRKDNESDLPTVIKVVARRLPANVKEFFLLLANSDVDIALMVISQVYAFSMAAAPEEGAGIWVERTLASPIVDKVIKDEASARWQKFLKVPGVENLKMTTNSTMKVEAVFKERLDSVNSQQDRVRFSCAIAIWKERNPDKEFKSFDINGICDQIGIRRPSNATNTMEAILKSGMIEVVGGEETGQHKYYKLAKPELLQSAIGGLISSNAISPK